MFSKRAALIIALFAASGCGVHINEHPPAEMPLNVGGGQIECFTGAGKTLGDYFRGGTSDKQLSDIFACTSRSLQLFQKYFVGANPHEYKPDELRTFMERYFLKGFEISDEMLRQVMKLKTTLIGGREDLLTSDDLSRLQQLLDIFRDLAIGIHPYLPLTPAHLATFDRTKFEEAVAALQNTVGQLGQVLQQRTQPYAIDDLDSLLSEVVKFVEDPAYKDSVNTVRNYLPLFRQAKKILVSPDPDRMTEDDWHVLADTASEMYSLFLRLDYAYHNDGALYYGPGRIELMKTAEDGYRLLGKIIDRNPDQTIAFDDLDRLIDRADPELFEFGDPAYSAEKKKKDVKDFLRPLVHRYLRLGLSGAVPLASGRDGIRRENLDVLWGFLNSISEGQRYFEAALAYAGQQAGIADPTSASFDIRDLILPNDSLTAYLDRIFGVPVTSLDPTLLDMSTHLRQLLATDLKNHRPNFYGGGDLRATIGASVGAKVGMSALFERNWLRSASRLVLSAYAKDPQNLLDDENTGGLTKAELHGFYLDLKALGVDVDLFDPATDNSDQKRLRESDLFTWVANGDGLIGVAEASDLVGLLISGKRLSSETYQFAIDDCRDTLGPPIFGEPRVGFRCFQDSIFHKHYSKIWDHLPDLLHYYESLPPLPPKSASLPAGADQVIYRETFACLMGEVAYNPIPAGATERGQVDSSDGDQISAFAQYLEMLILRFDADHSGTISETEADAFYPVVRLYLKQAVAAMNSGIINTVISSDDDYKAVLTFLLAKGHVPSATEYLSWRYLPGTPHFEADRGRIAQILAMLSGGGKSQCFDVARLRREFGG